MTNLTMNDNQLLLVFSDKNEMNQFIKTSKYKIRLRRYTEVVENGTVFFKTNLNIHEMKKVIAILSEQMIDLKVEQRIFDYINKKEFFIESRYRVGNDIKKKTDNVVENYNFFKFRVNSLLKRELTEEQAWNAYYMTVMKNCSNFSVPGSGKTATVLGMYAFLKDKKEVEKIVMIGPKNAFGSWIDEFKICFGLEQDDFYLNIHSKELKTTKDRRYQLQFESGKKELILINYESLSSLKGVLLSLIDSRTILVFDEVHKIKNPIGQRASVAIEISKNAGRIVALTGTPLPNSYQDLFNVLNILYPEDYKDFFGYSISELKNAGKNEVDKINQKLKPFFCRVTKEQQNVPPPNKDYIECIEVSELENKLFKIIYQTYKSNLFGLMARLMQLASNPKLLLQNLDISIYQSIIDDESDFSGDVTEKDYTEDILQLVENIPETSKTNKTLSLIDRLISQQKKVLVWCVFVSSIQMLEKKCEERGLKVKTIYGETPLEERLKLITEYQNGLFDILITNPHTLAESVSLHQVCHDAIYYEYSFNLVHLLQSKDRIHRLGLSPNQYTQYYFMESKYLYNNQAYSLDHRIYQRLIEKERVMLDAVNNDTLEFVTSFEEDLEIVFRDFIE